MELVRTKMQKEEPGKRSSKVVFLSRQIENTGDAEFLTGVKKIKP